jgi:hypothetical protein
MLVASSYITLPPPVENVMHYGFWHSYCISSLSVCSALSVRGVEKGARGTHLSGNLSMGDARTLLDFGRPFSCGSSINEITSAIMVKSTMAP